MLNDWGRDISKLKVFSPYLERDFANFSLRHRKHFERYD